MKQGLSLRVSQHLALTPQLQQSIRLLQLSTLELSQEVEQMLDENPFLEVSEETAAREDFGVTQADAPVSADAQDFEGAAEPFSAPSSTSSRASEYKPGASSPTGVGTQGRDRSHHDCPRSWRPGEHSAIRRRQDQGGTPIPA